MLSFSSTFRVRESSSTKYSCIYIICIYIYEGCSKFLHAEKDIFAEKIIYFRQTLANLMFIFRGTSGEYRTGPRTNEPPSFFCGGCTFRFDLFA